jgi:hypothetical protein
MWVDPALLYSLIRAAAAQRFVTATVALLAAHRGGVRELARGMEVDEKTVRRWLALASGELRPISETNAIIAKLAKFADLKFAPHAAASRRTGGRKATERRSSLVCRLFMVRKRR